MSGRVRIRLPDGEWQTGYRKTERRQERREQTGPVENRLIFQLPSELAWSVASGAHGSAVDVGPANNVTVKSFDRDYTLRRAVEFLQGIGKGHEYINIAAVFQHAGGSRDTCQLALIKGSVMLWYGAAKPRYFPAR